MITMKIIITVIVLLSITMIGGAQPPQHKGKSKASEKSSFSHERKSPPTEKFQYRFEHKSKGLSGENHPGYRGRSDQDHKTTGTLHRGPQERERNNYNRGAEGDGEARKAMEVKRELFKIAMEERLTCPKCGFKREMPQRPNFDREEIPETIKRFRIEPPYRMSPGSFGNHGRPEGLQKGKGPQKRGHGK